MQNGDARIIAKFTPNIDGRPLNDVPKWFIVATGKSGGTKPSGAGEILTGSVYTEIDTGTRYHYDESTETWI